MTHPEITIIIPSVVPFEEVFIYQSYLESEIRQHLYVQFVYLRNGKAVTDQSAATLERFDTHEILRVPNDRFFGSCEENMYRMQDFVGMFKPAVFIIGHDDSVDWGHLQSALATMRQKRLDVLAWHVLEKHVKTGGGHSYLPLLKPLADHGLAHDYLTFLFHGEVLDSPLAYMAIISACGPLYWPPYIGNHLYSKSAFTKLFQYEFTDPVYSHIFKQAQLFYDYQLRYGFLDAPVVERLGNEFAAQKMGEYPWGRLAESRVVHGKPNVEQMPYVCGINELKGDALFAAYTLSLGTSNLSTEQEEQTYGQYSMLNEILSWSCTAIREKLSGKSYYFPNETASGSIQDIRSCYLFLQRLESSMQAMPTIYAPIIGTHTTLLIEAITALRHYLCHLNPASSLLNLAHEKLLTFQTSLTHDVLLYMNRASFAAYVKERQKFTGVML